jgi:AmmeMemoRadiSam system protein B
MNTEVDRERPKARRDLDYIPVQSADGTVIMIRDRLGLVREGRAINLELYHLLTMLDGTRSTRDIQFYLMRRQGGKLISIDEVEALLDEFDSSYLLDSLRYREVKKKIISDFSSQQIRYCSHAGVSYPKEKEALGERLDDILATQQAPSFPQGNIAALVAPHIDLEAGKRVYSSAYQAIQGLNPERVIILGVGHSMQNEMFSLTSKTFETPLGKVNTDKGIVTDLMKAGDHIVSDEDFAHRDEHSIEFQLIFLQHVLRGIPFTIVPILCGSLRGSLSEYNRETYLSIGGDFLKILADAAGDERTVVVAGVDFSHVGPKFGHDMPASLILTQSERHDRRLIQCLCDMDVDAYWSESRALEDKYHVCGFSALACLSEILPTACGYLLNYEIFKENLTKSAVSFAAIAFVG